MTLAGLSIAFVQPHIGAREFAHGPRTATPLLSVDERHGPALSGEERHRDRCGDCCADGLVLSLTRTPAPLPLHAHRHGAPGRPRRPVSAFHGRGGVVGQHGVPPPPGPRGDVTEPMAAGVRTKSHPCRPAGLPPMADDHEADLDAIVDILTDAGLIESYIDADGKPALRLTAQGAQMGRALAMSDDAETVLAALLDASPP